MMKRKKKRKAEAPFARSQGYMHTKRERKHVLARGSIVHAAAVNNRATRESAR